MNRFRATLLILALPGFLFAVEYRGPDGISFDLPEGWAAFGEERNESFSFTNASRDTFVQVFRFVSNDSVSLIDLYDMVASSLDAAGDRVPYAYAGREAVFASISFDAAGAPVAGYAFCARASGADVVIIGYGPEGGERRDEILSAIDSVALSDDELTVPGPVSQFMLVDDGEDATAIIDIGDFSTRFDVDTGQFEIAQLVVEREARLLSRSDGTNVDAWRRFYRMIYRDGYARFGVLGTQFAAFAARRDDREVAEMLLAWVQSWEYTRTGTLADLLNPYEAALRESGDCDSRGLVYATLLHYAGIDSVLLVSSEYSHSVSAVLVDGTGARIDTEKGSQVIAETTEDVPLGMIASDQADPSAWIVVDLDGRRGPW